MDKYKGIFTALLTPFDKENRINEKELERLVKFCLDRGVKGFYVGGSTAEAFLLSTDERKQIMDVVKSVAPFYYKFTFDEIKNYYFRLADSAELPMLVYHFPAFSGVNMGASEMSKFLSDERFLGIKYTSNDFFTLEQCKTNFPHKVVYNGFDEMLLSGLVMGADGGIGSTYNFMADKFVKIYIG